MNDSRVTASNVRYRSGDVWAECEVCGATCRAEWTVGDELQYVGDDFESVGVIDATWTVPGCPHIDLPRMVHEVENYLERNNRPQSEPDPDRFRDDNEGRYDG